MGFGVWPLRWVNPFHTLIRPYFLVLCGIGRGGPLRFPWLKMSGGRNWSFCSMILHFSRSGGQFSAASWLPRLLAASGAPNQWNNGPVHTTRMMIFFLARESVETFICHSCPVGSRSNILGFFRFNCKCGNDYFPKISRNHQRFLNKNPSFGQSSSQF